MTPCTIFAFTFVGTNFVKSRSSNWSRTSFERNGIRKIFSFRAIAIALMAKCSLWCSWLYFDLNRPTKPPKRAHSLVVDKLTLKLLEWTSNTTYTDRNCCKTLFVFNGPQNKYLRWKSKYIILQPLHFLDAYYIWEVKYTIHANNIVFKIIYTLVSHDTLGLKWLFIRRDWCYSSGREKSAVRGLDGSCGCSLSKAL